MTSKHNLALAAAVVAVILGCGNVTRLIAQKEGDDPGECEDKADNDGNGAFDCDDAACAGSPTCKAQSAEAKKAAEDQVQRELCANVEGIRVAEFAYDAAFDAFVDATHSPRPLDQLDANPVPWKDAGGFTDLGWRPDGESVRGTYWVESESLPNGMGEMFVAFGAAKTADGALLCCATVASFPELEPGMNQSPGDTDPESCRKTLRSLMKEVEASLPPPATPKPSRGGGGSHASPTFHAGQPVVSDCSGVFESCNRVECPVSNTGDAPGEALVTASYFTDSGEQRQNTEVAYLIPGELRRVAFQFKAIDGGSFVCAAESLGTDDF